MKSEQDILDEMNRIVSKHFSLTTRSPRYRYFESEKKHRYFWTTARCNHKGKQMFVSGIYRHYKTKRMYKLMKRVGHAKRHKAKARALKMSNQGA